MSHVTLRTDNETDRILQSHWRDETPQWANEQRDGTTVISTHIDHSKRESVLQSALDTVEADVDYDTDTETASAQLYYDSDKDELYGDVIIRSVLM